MDMNKCTCNNNNYKLLVVYIIFIIAYYCSKYNINGYE